LELEFDSSPLALGKGLVKGESVKVTKSDAFVLLLFLFLRSSLRFALRDSRSASFSLFFWSRLACHDDIALWAYVSDLLELLTPSPAVERTRLSQTSFISMFVYFLFNLL